MKIAGVLLAAGLSTRMGRPKQLLPLAGVPLCRHAAQTLAQAGYSRLLAVIPAGKLGEQVQEALDGLNLEYIQQKHPQQGLSSSISLAARTFLAHHPSSNGAAFALADMPYVTAQTHHLLCAQAQAGAGIVLTQYAAPKLVQAPPSYFAAQHFAALTQLTGDTGPRALIQQHAAQVRYITRPAAELRDIDTPQDYALLVIGESAKTPQTES